MSAEPMSTAPTNPEPALSALPKPHSLPKPKNAAELAAWLENGQGFAPTEAQAQVIEQTEGPVLVVAGAGSGKTRTMAEKVAWIVAQGLAEPHEILGVTFTRKAASELGHRIRTKLLELNAHHVRHGHLEADDADLDDLDADVSTYHSYAARLVSDYGVRLGLEPGTPILGEAQAHIMISSIIENWELGRNPLVDQVLLGQTVGTMVSTTLALASQRAEHDLSWDEIEQYYRELLTSAQSAAPAGRKKAGQAEAEQNAAAKGLITVLQRRLAGVAVARVFEERKKQEDVRDFGDLLTAALRLVRRFPDVARAEREQYKYVLLDEFQDTSHTQMQLFAALFAADAGHNGADPYPGANVTAVGDPNQSIYGFRGASAGQLAAYAQAFSKHRPDGEGVRQFNLAQAWRNPTSVLELANGIASPLRHPAEFQATRADLPQVHVPALEPGVGASAGEVIFHRAVLQDLDAPDALARLESAEPDAVAPFREHLQEYADGRSEVRAMTQFIAERRQAHQQQLAALPLQERRHRPPLTFAVLTRTRGPQQKIAQALAELGVPYEVTAAGALLEEPEIVELLAYLHALGDVSRSDAVVRILTSAKFQLSPADLAAFGDWSKAVTSHTGARRTEDSRQSADEHELGSLVMALDAEIPEGWTSRDGRTLSPEGWTRIGRARELMKQIRDAASEDLVDTITQVEQLIGLDVEIASIPGEGAVQARRNIDAFLQEASKFMASTASASLTAFLSWLESAEENEKGLAPGEVEQHDDVVQIMTMHASKGLEWDVVLLPDLIEGTFPSTKSSLWTKASGSALPYEIRGDAANLPAFEGGFDTDKELAAALKQLEEENKESEEREERRLAYVAMTRAKQTLWLSTSDYRSGNVKPVSPSPYFLEALSIARSLKESGHGLTLTEGADLDAAAPAKDLKNPLGTLPGAPHLWPMEPFGARRAAVMGAAGNVMNTTLAARTGEEGHPLESLTTGRGRAWAREAEFLIERQQAVQQAQERGDITLPPVMSVSAMVSVAADEVATLKEFSRPVPHKPSRAARAGTTFHAFLEDRFNLIGALDEGPDGPGENPQEDLFADGEELDEMQSVLLENFLASEWAQRQPYSVEELIETKIAGQRVKGRVDAVFFDEESGTWTLVDWKTGRVPAGRDLQNKSLQLALYRLGWSQRMGIALEKIRVAFYYVAHNRTVYVEAPAEEADLTRMFLEATGQQG